MEPTSNTDSTRPPRGLARLWSPIGSPEQAESDAAENSGPLPGETEAGETEMVALGRGSESFEFSFSPASLEPPVAAGFIGPAPRGPVASAGRGPGSTPSSPDGPQPPDSGSGSAAKPGSGTGSGSAGKKSGQPFGPRPGGSPDAPGGLAGQHQAADRDPDHSGPSGDEEGPAQAVESSRTSPWDRDPGTFGGFGLSGRNGRFLLGGRTAEPRPGLNGRGGTELNGRTANSASAQLGDRDSADRPVSGQPAPHSAGTTAADTADQAERSDENGREEMNGRAGVPGYAATGDSGAAENGDTGQPGRRRDLSDVTEAGPEPRRPATGWASVPTSTNPVVSPTSAVPTSGAPLSAAPVSSAPTSGAPTSGAPFSAAPVSPGYAPPVFPAAGYGQPPTYAPTLPDPTPDPVSAVPAPRSAGQVSPAAPDLQGYGPGAYLPADGRRDDNAAGIPGFQPSFGTGPSASTNGVVPTSAAPPAGSAAPTSGPGSPAGPTGADSGPGSVGSAVGFGGETGSLAGRDPAADPGAEAGPTAGRASVSGPGSPAGPVSAAGLGSPSALGAGLGSTSTTGSPAVSGSASPSGPGSPTGTVSGTASLAGPRTSPDAAGRASTADLGTTGRAGSVADTGLGTSTTAGPAEGPTRFGAPAASTGLRDAPEGIALGGRRAWDDDTTPRTPAPRRSASLEDAEPVRRGRRAAPDDEDTPDEVGMRPGDVEPGHIAFWDDDATRHFRAAWHEVKAEFVDDPVTALTRAHDLLTDAVNELTEALLAERDELDPLRGTATPDTESMRMAMRGYREFLDRILAL
ncbi:hypothetical protein ACWKSP_22720 [Micromonosporaceae bacterium Da 78-11]